jgi:hypothetical protein
VYYTGTIVQATAARVQEDGLAPAKERPVDAEGSSLTALGAVLRRSLGQHGRLGEWVGAVRAFADAGAFASGASPLEGVWEKRGRR